MPPAPRVTARRSHAVGAWLLRSLHDDCSRGAGVLAAAGAASYQAIAYLEKCSMSASTSSSSRMSRDGSSSSS